MLDLLGAEILKSAVTVAKNLLGKRLLEKNDELLELKRKKETSTRQLKLEHINLISLEPKETFKAELKFSENESLARLALHLEEIKSWSSRVSFLDMRGSKGLNSIYIELDTYLMPLRTHISSAERSNVKPLEEAVFSNTSHCVVLGQPGSGKTTSMKKLCVRFFEEQGLYGYSFPILLNFRELEEANDYTSIQRHLKSIFPLELTANNATRKALDEDEPGSLATDLFAAAIDALKAVVILEGFDEIRTSRQKESILQELRTLASKLRNTKLVVTCRTGEFNYSLDRCDMFEISPSSSQQISPSSSQQISPLSSQQISPLSSQQISTFAEKWIGAENAQKFLADMKKSPF